MILRDCSYVFNHQDEHIKRKSEIVTVSSTIVDEHGIIRPRLLRPYSLATIVNENKIDFSWSMPLKSQILQLPTKSSQFIHNIDTFERNLMKISIATNSCPSEIALSNSDDTLDSLLDNKRIDFNEYKHHRKRFCSNSNYNQGDYFLKNLILENVNQCAENLSKILNESCSTLLSDGIILYRGKQFGFELGEPLVRKRSSHSICELNRLLTEKNIFLMRQYQIETIEDLVRIYGNHGEGYFDQLMKNTFEINAKYVEELKQILRQWTKHLALSDICRFG